MALTWWKKISDFAAVIPTARLGGPSFQGIVVLYHQYYHHDNETAGQAQCHASHERGAD
jgi:hypothetical protein